MKLPKEIENILKNKYVLYIVAFLAFTNVIGYLAIQDFNSLLFFVLIGYLTSYFSKNMTIVLLSSLILTNLLFSTRKMTQNLREGMTNKKNKDKKSVAGKKTPSKKKKEDDESEDESEDKSKDETKKEEFSMNARPNDVRRTGNIKQGGQSLNISPNNFSSLKMTPEEFKEQQRAIKQNLQDIKPMLDTARELMDTIGGAKGMLNQMKGFSGMLGGTDGLASLMGGLGGGQDVAE